MRPETIIHTNEWLQALPEEAGTHLFNVMSHLLLLFKKM